MTRPSIRALRDTTADAALGTELVREYVVATADETGIEVDVVVGLVPDLHDFASRYLRGGAYLVATVGDELAGGVGVTPGADGTCEMNRLWVRPPFRRLGLGRALASASLRAARELGFTRMVLDVVPGRTGAIALYRSLGFVEIAPIHHYGFPMVAFARDL
jgi:ribosomal protein S18 acetylase RimI-like enzyme